MDDDRLCNTANLTGRFDGFVETELQFELRAAVVVSEFAVQQARLNVGAVLILVFVTRFAGAEQFVIGNLTHLHLGVDANGLDAVHFERPRSAVSGLAETSAGVENQPESAQGRSCVQDRDEVLRFGVLDRSSEVEHAGLQSQTLGGDFDSAISVRTGRIENDFLVDEQFVIQRKVVAVGVQTRGIEGVNYEVFAHPRKQFLTG